MTPREDERGSKVILEVGNLRGTNGVLGGNTLDMGQDKLCI